MVLVPSSDRTGMNGTPMAAGQESPLVAGIAELAGHFHLAAFDGPAAAGR